MSLAKVSQCLIIVLGLMILDVNAFSDTLTINGTDDIYASGHSTLPATIYPGAFPLSSVQNSFGDPHSVRALRPPRDPDVRIHGCSLFN